MGCIKLKVQSRKSICSYQYNWNGIFLLYNSKNQHIYQKKYLNAPKYWELRKTKMMLIVLNISFSILETRQKR